MKSNPPSRPSSESILQRILRRLCDPSPERYSAIVTMRTFGRGRLPSAGASRADGPTTRTDGTKEKSQPFVTLGVTRQA